MDQHIAFITYETPYAPGGGVAAVMAHLPQAIQSASNIPTFVITPFHFNNEKTKLISAEMKIMASIKVHFDSKNIPVDIMFLPGEVSWVFLNPNSAELLDYELFAGKKHPYDVPAVDSNGHNTLLRDSLFFGKSAQLAIDEICPSCAWTVLMQDWEAATTVLFVDQTSTRSERTRNFLTLHNSYDCGLPQDILNLVGLESLHGQGVTVLDAALPLLKDPIFTVSEQFALDLSSEILQFEIMIPHIVHKLAPRIKGINNGIFINQQIPMEIYQAGLAGNHEPLADWKAEKRHKAIDILKMHTSTRSEPVWGDVKEFVKNDYPWFVMAGRDDSRQKGYDLACIAIEMFLIGGGEASFIFFPIPGDEGLAGIQYIKSLTEKYPGQVLGFPFMFRTGYFPILQGAAFGMMPSYYEPFGMANEFYLNGVSCIGRATGGILQQIVPNRQAASFNRSTAKRANRWHAHSTPPSGFLFREPDGIPSASADWQRINSTGYSIDSQKPNRLDQRKDLPLIQAMAGEMKLCLEEALNQYNQENEHYYEGIVNGISFITSNFSWSQSAEEYIGFISPQIIDD